MRRLRCRRTVTVEQVNQESNADGTDMRTHGRHLGGYAKTPTPVEATRTRDQRLGNPVSLPWRGFVSTVTH
ncbi:unnamed protein product [Merluccius merluccius]